MQNKRLTRSESNKMIGGVCAGLANYLSIDPTIVRLIFAALLILYGQGLLIYLILWIVMPEDKANSSVHPPVEHYTPPATATPPQPSDETIPPTDGGNI